MMDLALNLEALIPAAQYGGSLTANTQEAYDAIRWDDDRPKPTWEAIHAVVPPADVQKLVIEAYNTVLTEALTQHPEDVTPAMLDDIMAREGRIEKAFMKGIAIGVTVARYNVEQARASLPEAFSPYCDQILAQLPGG
jgi:hypothetical protein